MRIRRGRSYALVRFLETEFAGYRFEKMTIRARFYTQIKVKQRRGVCAGQFAAKFDERTNERPNLRVVTQDFTVSPRCKSTVITMSLHRVTRIRSSNRASASVRAACVHMESSRFRPRSLPNVSLRATYLAHRLRYSKPSEDFILACAYFACSSINYTTSRNVPLLKLERIDVFVAQELQRRREIN